MHCVEHGTLIEPDTAAMAAEAGTSIVPTLAVMAALVEHGRELGYPDESLAKLDMVKDEAVDRLRHIVLAERSRVAAMRHTIRSVVETFDAVEPPVGRPGTV